MRMMKILVSASPSIFILISFCFERTPNSIPGTGFCHPSHISSYPRSYTFLIVRTHFMFSQFWLIWLVHWLLKFRFSWFGSSWNRYHIKFQPFTISWLRSWTCVNGVSFPTSINLAWFTNFVPILFSISRNGFDVMENWLIVPRFLCISRFTVMLVMGLYHS